MAETTEKKDVLDFLEKVIVLLKNPNEFFKKLQECILHILTVDDGRIVESINIKEASCFEATLKLRRKYWRLAKEIERKRIGIKVGRKTFLMSKGALLAKIFVDFIGKDFSEVISYRILEKKTEKKIEVTEEDYLLISNIPAFVVLCLLLSEFWKADADHDDLEKIGSLVISNQDKVESLVTIFNILLGEI